MPFEIKRVYYLYDVPGGAERGGHAHKKLHQLIIALSGSFDVILDDGKQKKRFHLNRSYYGIYVCPMIWRELDNFSSASVCLVLASNLYEEADYYRNYQEFVQAPKYMKVPFLELKPAYEELRADLDAAYRRVMESGQYLLGRNSSSSKPNSQPIARRNSASAWGTAWTRCI